jgi:transposase InsO family protein
MEDNATQLEEQYNETIQSIVNNVDSAVPDNIRSSLSELLHQYRDVISLNDSDLGHVTIVQHTIDTGDHRPIRETLRPHPRAHLPIIDKMIDDMLEQGVIEPSRSEWASNITLARKKDNTWRFCCDTRKLNLITKKDLYPLKRIDTCLDTLAGSIWFSTLDMRSGFHQISMDEKDRDKTSFLSHRGSFRWTRMPYGLCNSPATFQRVMDTVMVDLDYKILLTYIDDVIVFSRDLETHVQRLQLVLDALQKGHLKVKPSKVKLLQTEVSVLGFKVSNQGLSTQEDKVEAIKTWPTPRSLQQTRSFIGLAQYYRKFVPHFATIAEPLHALSKKGARFLWTDACQNAFEQLKQKLTDTEVLALPKDGCRYILDCDASDVGMGAVLSQIQDDQERPIAYASQLFDRHQRNYSVTRKELLSLITFVKKFKQYLLGQPTFLIRTDHAALQWLKRTPEPIGQQARWLEVLEEFNYEVEHRAGNKHCNADALSRRPVDVIAAIENDDQDWRPNRRTVKRGGRGVPATQPTTNTADTFNWPAIQQTDDDVSFVYQLVENGQKQPKPEVLTARSADVKVLCSQFNRLTLSDNGTLCRIWTNSRRQDKLQIVVPFDRRQGITDDLHKGLNGGHLGIRRSKLLLQQRFYWPGWSKDVYKTQQRCEQCARHKPTPHSRQGLLQPMVTGQPWERLGIDVTGPHPPSDRRNVYILTVIDHFTKWTEMFAMKNQEAATIAKILVDQVFCRYGMPLQILTDLGKNFESQLFSEMCRCLSIDKIRTTAYKPSTNGNIERFHGTLNSILSKWVADNQRDWDLKLPAVAFVYRNSVSEATGFTPFYLMHGREARIPADLVYDTYPDEQPPLSPIEHVDNVVQTLRDAFSMVRQHLGKAAETRKDRYDMRVRPTKYPVGTWVWHQVSRRRQRLSYKWQDKYDGPYLVVKEAGPVNVAIQKSPRAHAFYVHIDKLKPCFSTNLRSWIPRESARNDLNGPAASNTSKESDASLPSGPRPTARGDQTSNRSDSQSPAADDTPSTTDAEAADDRNDQALRRSRRHNIQKPARYRQ